MQMIEVSKEQFQRIVKSLDVIYTPFEYDGKWELRNGRLVGTQSTGYKNKPFCSRHEPPRYPTRYFVVPDLLDSQV